MFFSALLDDEGHAALLAGLDAECLFVVLEVLWWGTEVEVIYLVVDIAIELGWISN